MKSLAEGLFTGKWKSFKTFMHSGSVKLSSASLFKEFDFSDDHILTISNRNAHRTENIVQTEAWVLEFQNKRYYLKVPSCKLMYEVVTINHTVLVLMDNTSMEKTFFAKEQHWQNFLQSNKQAVL